MRKASYFDEFPDRNLIFISFSRSDETTKFKAREELSTALKPLFRDWTGHEQEPNPKFGRIEDPVWFPDEESIRPGDDWLEEIRTGVARTRLAVLLVGAGYLAMVSKKSAQYYCRFTAAFASSQTSS